MPTLRTRIRRRIATYRAKRKVALVVVPGNLMSVSTGPRHAAAILQAYLDLGADAYLLSECADLDVNQIQRTHPGEYVVIQRGRTGSPESGVAIVLRRAAFKSIGVASLEVGTEQTSEGGGIRMRPILTVKARLQPRFKNGPGRRIRLKAGHAAPARASRAREIFVRRFLRIASVRGGDMNLTAPEIARRTDDDVFGSGVIVLTVPKSWHATLIRRVPGSALANADHGCPVVALY